MIRNFDDVCNNTNLRNILLPKDIDDASKYISSEVNRLDDMGLNYRDGSKIYNYEIYSSLYDTYYNVSVLLNGEFIRKISCDCHDFFINKSCSHCAAVFLHDYNFLFNSDKLDDIRIFSKDILKKFSENNAQSGMIKKEVIIKLEFDVQEKYNYYYGYTNRITPKILIGDDKMYSLGSHISSFNERLKTGKGTVKFGKNFIYDPKKYYLSDESKLILNAYNKLILSKGKYYSDADIKELFYDIKDVTFVFNDYQINGISDKFPLVSNLIKENDVYKLDFDLDGITKIFKDYEYIMYSGKMYHLTDDENNLITRLVESKFNHLEFEEEDLNDFTTGILHNIKNTINISNEITNISIPENVNVELYFDIRSTKIMANPKFIYDGNKIDYFDDTNILRDINVENKVINNLIQYGFIRDKKCFILEDLDEQVYFIEHGLDVLNQLYPIFTTEKFKKISVKKNVNISSTFSIGQDNILNYQFDLGDIDSKELVGILKNVKAKKKYYRLNNGDILNLEDTNILELNELTENLELTDDEIINGKGTLMKYRAIYLDSIKNFNIIKKDSLFNNFIDEFYKNKNGELSIDTNNLRDYQVIGVKWLYNLAKCGFGGILADEMGLGKTIQVIYYIKQMLKDNPDNKFLIVVPTSLSYNWQHEFEMFGNEINVTLVLGNKNNRISAVKNIESSSVIITTYGLLREDEELYQNINFNTIIVDEAQNIKNSKAGVTLACKKINALTKFALTGTPVENSVLELWSIFDFIMPGYLSNITKFQAKYHIKEFDAGTTDLLSGLSRNISPFILRRKKTDVLAELPEKLINDVYIELSPIQKELYASESKKVKEEMTDLIKTDGIGKARFMILQLMTRLRQICIDPSIVYDNVNETSNKIETLSNIVSEYIENGHKILIFSSFRGGLDSVKKELSKKNILTYQIDGSTKAIDRINMVNKFNNEDDVKVFLIMLKAGGVGLNLTGSDVVIHLDLWWNPQAENQATDRAHRIGQTKNVEVIHLIAKGTIEEKILELQNKKKILSDKLIDNTNHDKNLLSELSEKDILNLLSFENKD